MSFVVTGGALLAVGIVMSQDIGGLGTKWRNVGMRYYDRRSGPEAYLRITKRFKLAYLAVAVFGLILFVLGLLSL